MKKGDDVWVIIPTNGNSIISLYKATLKHEMYDGCIYINEYDEEIEKDNWFPSEEIGYAGFYQRLAFIRDETVNRIDKVLLQLKSSVLQHDQPSEIINKYIKAEAFKIFLAKNGEKYSKDINPFCENYIVNGNPIKNPSHEKFKKQYERCLQKKTCMLH